jgi:hypothetical protein
MVLIATAFRVRVSLFINSIHLVTEAKIPVFPWYLQFPSVYPPLSNFRPPCPSPALGLMQSTGPPPNMFSNPHFRLYNQPISLSYPILNNAALLAWLARIETALDRNAHTLELRLQHLPETVEEARRIGQPTRQAMRGFQTLRMDVKEDYTPWKQVRGRDWGYDEMEDKVFVGENPEWHESEDQVGGAGNGHDGEDDPQEIYTPSKEMDPDWYRIVSSSTTGLPGNRPLEGPAYEIGSISGKWKGRLVVRSFSVSAVCRVY